MPAGPGSIARVHLLQLPAATFCILSSLSVPTRADQSTSCEWWGDPCPWPLDGECDQSFSTRCENGDCFDCDPLQEHHYDCQSCISAQGYWCPGDALCRGQPLNEAYYSFTLGLFAGGGELATSIKTSCPLAQDWQQTCGPAHHDNVFSDPLYDAMNWSYDMINVEAVWRQGITGAGVHVRINDDGVDASHPEFSQRFDVANSCQEAYLPLPPINNDSNEDIHDHGTACASIVGAQHDNNHCAVGIAPGVTLSSCTVVNPLIFNQGAELFVKQLQEVDISSNSWGPSPCKHKFARTRFLQQQCPFEVDHQISPCRICGGNLENNGMDLEDGLCRRSIIHHCTQFYELDPIACAEYLDLFVDCNYHALSPTEHQVFVRAITEGRNGKGIIFTFPAGNEFPYGSNANLDGFVNSRFTIAVGAVDKVGKRTAYSTPGSPVLISAPGGDLEYISNNIVAKPGGGCHDAGAGTSFSTPVVSGVIALMLEVRPELTWRDVQGILVVTAQQNDPDDDSWNTRNGAGLNHSYFFGFGLVDAFAAVELAKTWELWDPEIQIMVESGTINLNISDDPTQSATSTVTVPADYVDFVTESVVVYMDLQHGSRGDLAIVLESPSGTESLLAPSKRPENTQLQGEEHWKLTTVRNWGESASGNWTLKIADEAAGILEDCVDVKFDYYYDADGTLLHIKCDSFQNTTACLDGQILNDVVHDFIVDNGNGPISAAEACCVCGGGVQVDDIPHILESWSMIVYGHNAIMSSNTSQQNGTNDTTSG
ncbi:Furin-like protease 1, isoform 1 [Seminavis robusta]|uniref:subtilisin n=1 Tax=Seminavis robusta TaxID=568900 RepID=A0A9N8H1G7_9STRA|nr:Furin-like protease 1, isoform 1 [Seminavis robusta]|eukprot:Sro3_g002780.1 Furin-like protease 1, isoform 1 (768) ;mRNA; f:240491-243354